MGTDGIDKTEKLMDDNMKIPLESLMIKLKSLEQELFKEGGELGIGNTEIDKVYNEKIKEAQTTQKKFEIVAKIIHQFEGETYSKSYKETNGSLSELKDILGDKKKRRKILDTVYDNGKQVAGIEIKKLKSLILDREQDYLKEFLNHKKVEFGNKLINKHGDKFSGYNEAYEIFGKISSSLTVEIRDKASKGEQINLLLFGDKLNNKLNSYLKKEKGISLSSKDKVDGASSIFDISQESNTLDQNKLKVEEPDLIGKSVEELRKSKSPKAKKLSQLKGISETLGLAQKDAKVLNKLDEKELDEVYEKVDIKKGEKAYDEAMNIAYEKYSEKVKNGNISNSDAINIQELQEAKKAIPNTIKYYNGESLKNNETVIINGAVHKQIGGELYKQVSIQTNSLSQTVFISTDNGNSTGTIMLSSGQTFELSLEDKQNIGVGTEAINEKYLSNLVNFNEKFSGINMKTIIRFKKEFAKLNIGTNLNAFDNDSINEDEMLALGKTILKLIYGKFKNTDSLNLDQIILKLSEYTGSNSVSGRNQVFDSFGNDKLYVSLENAGYIDKQSGTFNLSTLQDDMKKSNWGGLINIGAQEIEGMKNKA